MMGLVSDDDVEARLMLVQSIEVLGSAQELDRADRADRLAGLERDLTDALAVCRPVQALKIELNPLVELPPPLLRQCRRTNDENVVERRPSLHLHQDDAGLDG